MESRLAMHSLFVVTGGWNRHISVDGADCEKVNWADCISTDNIGVSLLKALEQGDYLTKLLSRDNLFLVKDCSIWLFGFSLI